MRYNEHSYIREALLSNKPNDVKREFDTYYNFMESMGLYDSVICGEACEKRYHIQPDSTSAYILELAIASLF